MVDCGFEPLSGQIKDYKIGICCFPAMHTALRSEIGWLEIMIMCLSDTTYLSMDFCFNELAL